MYQYCMSPEVPRQENAFSQYGTLGHSLLEGWAKEELFECDLAHQWELQYASAVTLPFPFASKTGYDQKYYEAGRSYFESFHGFGEKWSQVLGAEESFTTEIEGFLFRGIADLILRCPETDEILLIDHKSKSSSSMRKDKESIERQLLIYAGHVKRKYGKFPDLMQVNLFKEHKVLDFPFVQEHYDAAISWVGDMAMTVSSMTSFPRHEDYYFCNNICSVRDYCLKQRMIENPGAFASLDI